MKAHPLRRAGAILGPAAVLAAALTLSGCSITSPSLITNYDAGDGVSATITDPLDGSSLDLRNFVVVAEENGTAGRVVGTLVNSGSTAVEVTLVPTEPSVGQIGPTTITVPAHGVTKVGFGGGPEIFLRTVSPAGTFIAMSPKTAAGGTVQFNVPVVPPTNYYATLAPPSPLPGVIVPTLTAPPTGTPAPTGSPTATPTP